MKIFESFEKAIGLLNSIENSEKELYDKESGDLQLQINEKTKEVKKLESSVDADILTKYKQRRKEVDFPVIVPVIDKTCGGCHMELPSAFLANLKSKGVLECEHCHRYIYWQE